MDFKILKVILKEILYWYPITIIIPLILILILLGAARII